MPGRLIMDTNGAEGARFVVNGKQGPGVVAMNDSPGRPETISQLHKYSDPNALPNGDAGIPGRGPYPTPNGVSPTSPGRSLIPASIQDLPPEILHITEGFQSLGTLVERVSQECFNNLSDVVDELAAMPVQSQTPMTNGIGNHALVNGVGNMTKENVRKKELMLEFAQQHRTRFIKLLVLSQWSQHAKDMSQLIDLRVWFNKQIEQYESAAYELGFFKTAIHPFKLPSPDMQTALNVLSTGKVPWTPDFNYIPLPSLTPQKSLKTLKNLNTLLSIRLVLHEDLIPQLRDYRIANGRATFTFPSEFELDVTIRDEDPSTSFFFLDVRFLFSPAPPISSGLLDQIDFRLNSILSEHGLRGACDFIHSFILTHKIAILRRQAQELSRANWASSLRIEQVHRILVVQYWVESPQAKSWLEIGIHSGKRKSAARSSDNAITSMIKARWIRNGKEVADVEIPLDLKDLSMERALKRVIALHTSYILRSTHDRLASSLAALPQGSKHILSMQLTTSETEPVDCSLRAQLGDHPPVTMGIDSTTGQVFLHPASPTTPRAHDLERMKDPAIEAHTTLARFLFYDVQRRIEAQAEHAGWAAVRNISIRPEVLNEKTRSQIQRHGFFRGRGWGESSWMILYTVSLSEECWWAAEILRSSSGYELLTCHKLSMQTADLKQPPLSQQLFKKIQQFAARAISYLEADKSLKQLNVESALCFVSRKPPDLGTNISSEISGATVQQSLPALCIRFSHLLRDFAGKDQFAADLLQLSYLGFETDLGNVKLVARGMMRKPDKLQHILKRARDDDVSFNATGSFSLVLRTRLGTSCVDRLVAQLRTIGRLCNFADVLKSRGLECTDISLSRVVFTYASDLTVELRFSGNDSAPITLKLAPNNPHRRIQVLLEQILNTSPDGFRDFTAALSFSLPLLTAFDTIEAKNALNFPHIPSVHPRTVDLFRLSYSNPPCCFDLRLKRNRDEMEWQIVDSTPGPVKVEERSKTHPGLSDKLKEVFRQVGTGWTGMQSSIVASKDGVQGAILKLDEVVGQFVPQAESTPAAVVLINGTQQEQQQQKQAEQKKKGPEVVVLD